MSIKRRVSKLEERTERGGGLSVPWAVEPDEKGMICAGEFLKWDELYERFPHAPVPLAWDGSEAAKAITAARGG